MQRRRLVVGLIAVVGVVTVVASGTAAAAEVSTANATATPESPAYAAAASGPTLLQTQELHRTPERPGEIRVVLQYDTPSNLAELRIRLAADATVTATDGFTERDGRLVWDERTTRPTVAYRLSVNETRDARGPIADTGDYVFVDAGEWALIRTPQVRNVEWSWTGGPENLPLEREWTVAGEGAVGDRITFLGPHEEREHTANGQRFRLVVPEAADMAESPGAVFDSLGDASETLDVGEHDETVFVVAAPTDSVGWAVLGLQTGDSDMWVGDRERLDTADNVWVHEYVHTVQDYEATSETRWFTEASATYYAALLSLRQGHIRFDQFHRRMARGERGSGTDAVLTDQHTWQPMTPYSKGALVAGDLDRRIRLSTGGGTLQSVLGAMNERGSVTETDLRSMVRRTGGSDAVAAFDRYTTTRDLPSAWSRDDHDEAFRTPLPRIAYAFAAPNRSGGFSVSGPYRSGPVDGDPLAVATGEQLTATVTVANEGSATGEYDARLRVDGRTADRERGTLAAGDERTVELTHQFGGPGEYALSVGEASRVVRVADPAAPTVTGLTAAPERPTPDEAVTLTASLRNTEAVPAVGELRLSRDDEAVATANVTLQPAERRDVTFEQSLSEPGTYRYRVGNRTADVTVGEAATPSPTAPEQPGFGVGIALAALAAALVARRATGP